MTKDVIEKAKRKAWLGDKPEKVQRKYETGSERELERLERVAATLSEAADIAQDAAQRARQVVRLVEAEMKKAKRRTP